MSCVDKAAGAADVFQAHRDELGFVNRAQCREKDLYTVERGGRVVAAALGNHCVRKPQTTLYELAVLPEYRREGFAVELVNRMAAESPHKKIVAKCPSELPSNQFYAQTGWQLTGHDAGKNRPLNVWQFKIPSVDVYMTVNNGGETAHTIRRSLAKVGVEAGNGWPLNSSPAFVDWPFTDPDAGFDEHLSKVREHKPQLTVAPDVEDGRTLDDVVPLADELAEYADNVIVVPKDCHPSDIPDRFRVGLTAGRFGSMAPWSVWEYRDCPSVHILGGSPSEQLEIDRHGVSVDSVDSFSLGRRAQFGMWDDGAVDAPANMNYYHRLKMSLNNYVRAWTDD
jgi:GNAT superfamily N-acetyltransferase